MTSAGFETTNSESFRTAVGGASRCTAAIDKADGFLLRLMWGMRKNPSDRNARPLDAMYWLQRSALKSARAWRLKMALREVCALARAHDDPERASVDKPRNTLVYLTCSDKLIEGSPQNSVTAVPVDRAIAIPVK